MSIFHLPDLGEGLPDAEIHTWHVKVGDTIAIDAPLVSMETAKAVVEVPSPTAGKILALFGQPGEVIKTGAPLVEFELAVRKDTGTVAGTIEEGNEVIEERALNVATSNGQMVKATPAVRALAHRLKIDLSMVKPTGPNSTITQQDVKDALHFEPAPIGYEGIKGVRRAMAQAMELSHRSVVPVTIFDEADVSSWAEGADITVRIIQALVQAIKAVPILNAWYDGKQIAIKQNTSVHVGLAVDTEEGLFVPVIRDAEQKDASALRAAVNQLRENVKARAVTPAMLQGATISISNFGVFAGKFATPIVVPPMVAILAVGRRHNNFIPLSLTFDHRAVTGGEASRFLGVLLEELIRP